MEFFFLIKNHGQKYHNSKSKADLMGHLLTIPCHLPVTPVQPPTVSL